MVNLYFIRHGQTINNVNGIVTGQLETQLTQDAIKEATQMKKEFQEDYDYYYCSPLQRTIQTLKLLKGNVPYIIDERIIDINFGDWQGKHRSQLDPEEYKKYKQKEFTPQNAESFSSVDKRIISFLDDMFTKYNKDEKILIVTHNIIIRYLKRMFYNDTSETKNLEVFEVSSDIYNEKIDNIKKQN